MQVLAEDHKNVREVIRDGVRVCVDERAEAEDGGVTLNERRGLGSVAIVTLLRLLVTLHPDLGGERLLQNMEMGLRQLRVVIV